MVGIERVLGHREADGSLTALGLGGARLLHVVRITAASEPWVRCQSRGARVVFS
jgi:hypothetical protein